MQQLCEQLGGAVETEHAKLHNNKVNLSTF